MKTSIKRILVLLVCALAGQAMAQEIQIGSAEGVPGQTVTIPVTFTAGPSPARDVTAIQLILGFANTYDLVAPTGVAAPLCGGDVSPLSAELCGWGSPNQPLAYQIQVVKATAFPSAVIARINFTIPQNALPGSVDNLTVVQSLVGTTVPLNPPATILAGQITIAKGDQTISNITANPASGAVGGSSTLSATASSGLMVTFGTTTPSICTVVGPTVSYKAAGTCTVTADQAGNDSFNAATQVTGNIAVGKAGQAITNFIATPAGGGVGETSTLSAVGGASGNAVVFGSATPAVCTVAGNTVTYVAAGACTATANQVGDANYNDAPQVTLPITVAKADQTITGFAANPADGGVGGSSTLSATASSNLTVVFGSSTPAVCTVAGSTVSYQATGTCTVTADQPGDANYNAASQVTVDIAVANAAQNITDFAANPASGEVDGTSTLSAMGGGSSNPVTFDSSTPSVCTVFENTVTYLTPGTCTVTADQAGDDNYNPATQVTLDIAVAKADQTITGFAATPASGEFEGSSTLSATASSGLTVAFGSSTPAVCTVADTTVTYVGAGTCTVTADQAGDAEYNAAPQVTLDITVAKADQTITGLAASPADGVVDGSSALSATASSGLTVAFGSSTPAVCTVAGTTVTYVAAGTCTVTADQAGDADYNAATQVTLNITVAKADQTITGLAANPAGGMVGGSSALSASVGSGLTIAFGSSTPAVCTVAGTTVSYIAVGACTVTADQAGDANYNAATQVTIDITVAQGDQTISGFTASPSTGYIGSTSFLSASASSGLAVTFGSNTPDVCTVSGSTVTYVLDGTCTVTADQAGNDNYTAAPRLTLGINVAINADAPIPTLSQWGLLSLFLIMLSIGGIVIRRKNIA